MFKNKLLYTLILTALSAPGLVLAADAPAAPAAPAAPVAPAPAPSVTSNVSLVSNYLYRGISQTGTKPAIQGGFDYAHASGFYAGVWGSSISWITDQQNAKGQPSVATSANVELDTYFGFKNSFATDYSYDVGFLRYNYPGNYVAGATKADTNEIYGLIGYKWISAKYSYALGDTFGVPDAQGTSYLNLTASYPVPNTSWILGAHYGKQTYKGSSAAYKAATASGDPTYSDYNLSVSTDLAPVSKDLSGYTLGLLYSKTNATSGGFYTVAGNDLGKGTAVLSLSRTF
jgi:uncharacterized protein (TIGR02001 family)